MSRKDLSLLNHKNFKFNTPIQIRFSDIDKMGHVNNAVVLSYCEIARVQYLDEVIGNQNNWFERGLIIAHTEIDYIKPILLRDALHAFVRITQTGTKSFHVEHVLARKENNAFVNCCLVESVLVCMDYHANKTIDIPAEWKQRMAAFEQEAI